MKLFEILSGKSPEKALNYLKKAKACAIDLNEAFYIASVDVAFGDFYYNRREFNLSLENYVNAYKLAQNNFTKENIAKIKMRISDLKIRMGEDNFNKIVKDINNVQ